MIVYFGGTFEVHGLRLEKYKDIDALAKKMEAAMRSVHPGLRFDSDVCLIVEDRAGKEVDDETNEDWQLETLATALATITTYTAQEALAELKSALHELKDSEGTATKACEAKMSESQYEVIQQLCEKLGRVREIAKAALTTTDSDKVVVNREKLEDLRDLARTGTPPASYGLGEDAWAKCRLHGIAGKLSALLKEE